METLRLDGRVAIVTGSGRGRGRGYALDLGRRGATLIVNDLGSDVDGIGASHSPAASTAEEIRHAGGTAYPDTTDVSDYAQVSALVARTISEYGRLDIIINNAGISPFSPFGEIDPESWHRVFAVHVDGTFNLIRAAWAHMCDREYGRIVNTVSTAIFGIRGVAHYAAAKGAILGLTKALALEGAPFNIGVNAVAPSGALSRMMRARLAYMQVEDGRTADRPDWVSETLTQMVSWLSHESCTLNGEVLNLRHQHVSRIFLAESGGVDMPTTDTSMIDAHSDQLLTTEGWHIPGDAHQSSGSLDTWKNVWSAPGQ